MADIPGTSKMKCTATIINGFKLKKCVVRIRKEILKSKLIGNKRESNKTAKNGEVKQTTPKTPNNKKSATNKIKSAKNTSRSNDAGVQVSKTLKSPPRSQNYHNLIFIRLPKITASDKTDTKDFKGKSSIKKNKNEAASYKFITENLIKKYGTKMFTSRIKLKRIKHSSLDKYDKKRKIKNKKNKSVSFIEEVEIFGTGNSNSSIEEVSNDLSEVKFSKINKTSTPLNKRNNERESNNDSKSRLRKRKISLKQYQIESKRPKRAVSKRVQYNEESQNDIINLDSSDDDDDVIAVDPLKIEETKNVNNKNRQELKNKIKNSREENSNIKDDTKIVNGEKEKNREKKTRNEEENLDSSINQSQDSNVFTKNFGKSKQSQAQEKEDIINISENVPRSPSPHTLKESENSILKSTDTTPKKRNQSNRENAEKNTSVTTESSSNSAKKVKLDGKSDENSGESFEDAISMHEGKNAVINNTEQITKHRLSFEEGKTKLLEEEDNEEVLSATQISRNIHGRKTYRSENNLTPYSDISDRVTPSLEQDNETIITDGTHESSKVKNKIFSEVTPTKDIGRSEFGTPKTLSKSSKSGTRNSIEDEINNEKNFDNNEIKDNDGKNKEITKLVTNENKSAVDYDNIVQNPTETPPDFLVTGEDSILTDDDDDLPISSFAKSQTTVTEALIHNMDSNSSNSSEIKNSPAVISDDLFDIVKRSEAPKETHLVSRETVGNVFGTAAGAIKTIDIELSHTDKHFIDDDFSDQFLTPEPFEDIMNDEHLHFSNTNDNDNSK